MQEKPSIEKKEKDGTVKRVWFFNKSGDIIKSRVNAVRILEQHFDSRGKTVLEALC